MTLFDDDLMSMVFDANIPATELVLKIILKRDDVKVISVVGQKELENPIVGGRNIRLDILAKDKWGELDTNFEDGSHILYVNGSYRGNDPVGRLMRDFSCKKAKDMHYKELADGVRHFKEEGGRELVCEAVERYAEKKAEEAAKKAAMEAEEAAKKAAMEAEKAAKKAAMEAEIKTAIKTEIKAGIAYNIDKIRIITRVHEMCGISIEEAEKLYDTYATMTVQ